MIESGFFDRPRKHVVADILSLQEIENLAAVAAMAQREGEDLYVLLSRQRIRQLKGKAYEEGLIEEEIKRYGAYISSLRHKYKLSQPELAKAVNMNASELSRLEHGKRNGFRIDKYVRLLSFFDVHLLD